MKRWSASLNVIFVVLLLLTTAAAAEDFRRCGDCHSRKLNLDRSRVYQHLPFSREECAACHAVSAAVLALEGTAEAKRKPGAADLEKRRKVNWLAESSMPADSHVFLLPSENLGETLVVELRTPKGESSQTKLAVPLLAELDALADSGGVPLISNTRVLEVQRRIFLSVTIGWNTDVLSDARVLYGIEEMNKSADAGRRLGKQHQVVLNQLKPDKTYRFKTVSRDLFGREQTSETLTFSTAKAIDLPAEARGSAADGEELKFTHKFFRQSANYVVELTLAQPANVFIGSLGEARSQAAVAEKKSSGSGPEDAIHAQLSSGVTLGTTACRSCHQKATSATHPVNVFPKPGMIIPPEFPTLPDGRISCVSCHATHGSDNESLSRKPGKRELCVGCHLDMM